MNQIPNNQIRHRKRNGASLKKNSNSANTAGTSTRRASKRGMMMLFIASAWAFQSLMNSDTRIHDIHLRWRRQALKDEGARATSTDKPFFVEISGASQLNQTQEEDVVEDALSTIVATLKEVNIRFYMYDHPNLTMAGNKALDRKSRRMLHFLNLEGANDKQMLEALAESPLRTYNTSEADLFIPPIPMASILASKDGNFNLPMQTLFEQEAQNHFRFE